ncbi:MAG TPA: DUF6134 family protein, partial [Chitinophagales bacterium]|nr:DUF6134 family protein [Chitinophagales bacterium]
MLKKTIYSALVLLLSTAFSFAQAIHFDITMFGDKIGTMTITRNINPDGTEHYVLESKSRAKVLWIDRENYTRYDVTYKDGKLLSSSVKEIENGAVKVWNNVTLVGGKYAVDSYKGKYTL